MVKPNKRAYREALVLLRVVKEKISTLGEFSGYFEEGYIDIDYGLDMIKEYMLDGMSNGPIYTPLAGLLGIEQDHIEEMMMWIHHDIIRR